MRLLFACTIIAFSLLPIGCAQKAPPNFSPAGARALKAKQALDGIQALSATAINLNAQTGQEHLTDRATAYVRDFALAATAAVQSYANGHDTLTDAVVAFNALKARLKAEPSLPATLGKALAIIQVVLQELAATAAGGSDGGF